MRTFLLALFGSFFGLMLATTIWASLKVSILNIPAAVGGHPWFIATLVDTYLSFLTIYAWVCFREKSIAAKMLWLLLFLVLGTMAHATYICIALARMPKDDWQSFFLGNRAAT